MLFFEEKGKPDYPEKEPLRERTKMVTNLHCQTVPAAGNFATFSQFLAAYSTFEVPLPARSPLAGKGTCYLLPTTPSMLPTATKHFDCAANYSVSIALMFSYVLIMMKRRKKKKNSGNNFNSGRRQMRYCSIVFFVFNYASHRGFT